MTDAEEKAEILSDAEEFELTFGSRYDAGSHGRMAIVYCAEILRREFSMSDRDKLDLALKILERVGPCTKEGLVDRLDFTRDESRRIVEMGLHSGTIEDFQDPEQISGRRRFLLRIPQGLE